MIPTNDAKLESHSKSNRWEPLSTGSFSNLKQAAGTGTAADHRFIPVLK